MKERKKEEKASKMDAFGNFNSKPYLYIHLNPIMHEFILTVTKYVKERKKKNLSQDAHNGFILFFFSSLLQLAHSLLELSSFFLSGLRSRRLFSSLIA